VLPSTPASSSPFSRGPQSPSQPQQPPPGLCGTCMKDPGAHPATWLATLAEQRCSEVAVASAVSKCMACHSGGLMGAVACENAECEVLYERLGHFRRLQGAEARLRRLDW
jgi:hypothetical protein